MMMRPDPTFHASPKLAMEAPPEKAAQNSSDVNPGLPIHLERIRGVRDQISLGCLATARRHRRQLVFQKADVVLTVANGNRRCDWPSKTTHL
jgi:hypothetical protein